MPADNVLGWRADTLALLRELDSPVYRWPGGNFVSGYDWKDGVGDPDRRPPRKNPAWKGVEHNDVGLHEFMDLCRLIGTAPYVAVNTGKGGPESARELVEYANGAATTPLGRKRAENGSSRPFGVKLWAVGNEMYGDWQIGHMPLSKYVEKHKAVVDAMRTADPAIEPIAVGAVGEWSQTMLRDASTHMAHLSEHLYWQSKPDVPAHVAQAGRGHPEGGRGAPGLPAGHPRPRRARTSGSRSTSGTTGTGRTSTASSAPATSCRTASGSRRGSTSSSATATSTSWRTTPRP